MNRKNDQFYLQVPSSSSIIATFTGEKRRHLSVTMQHAEDESFHYYSTVCQWPAISRNCKTRKTEKRKDTTMGSDQ